MKITQLQPERDVKPKAVMKTVLELMMTMELHLCCITFHLMQSFHYQHVSRPIPDITESMQCLEFTAFEISLLYNFRLHSQHVILTLTLFFLLCWWSFLLRFTTAPFTNTLHVENRSALQQLLAISLDDVYCRVDSLTSDIFGCVSGCYFKCSLSHRQPKFCMHCVSSVSPPSSLLPEGQ